MEPRTVPSTVSAVRGERYTFHMNPLGISLGSLVERIGLPGVWRLRGYERRGAVDLAVIEPHDDQAAGSVHVSQAYELRSPVRYIRLLRQTQSLEATGDRSTSACPICCCRAKLPDGRCVGCAAMAADANRRRSPRRAIGPPRSREGSPLINFPDGLNRLRYSNAGHVDAD